jgi:hypothetical protein
VWCNPEDDKVYQNFGSIESFELLGFERESRESKLASPLLLLIPIALCCRFETNYEQNYETKSPTHFVTKFQTRKIQNLCLLARRRKFCQDCNLNTKMADFPSIYHTCCSERKHNNSSEVGVHTLSTHQAR